MEAARTPADVTSLLLELGRAAKGRQFYPDGHPLLSEMLERCLLSWESNLASYGALDLELRKGAFCLIGSKLPLGKGTLDELAREFAVRGIRRIRAESDYARESFHGLLRVLSIDGEELRDMGGAGQWLIQEQIPGLTLNEINLRKHLEDPQRLATSAAGEVAEIDPALAGFAGEVPVEDGNTNRAADGALLLSALFDPNAPPPPNEASEDPLKDMLGFLEACRDDAPFRKLCTKIADHIQASEHEALDGKRFQALSALARHVDDAASRSAEQRSVAQRILVELCPEPVLIDLIARAFTTSDSEQDTAVNVLRTLREHGAAGLLQSIESCREADAREAMQIFLIGLGEGIIPALDHALQSGSPGRVRTAARVAGMMGASETVPSLCALLQSGRLEVCKEAVHALVRIGDRDALASLTEALHSPREAIASLAAFGLGSWRGSDSLTPLRVRLREAVPNDPIDTVQDLTRALGRLGRPEASSDLAELLEKHSLFRRRRLCEIQVAAATALGKIPCDGAQRALFSATQHRFSEVRQAAEQALAELTSRDA